MSENFVIGIVIDAIKTAFTMGGPLLLISMVIGLLISILQATTQIQEQTLTFVPKLIAIAAGGLFLGSFMLHTIMAFTERIFEMIIKITT